ncbi:MAG: 30S ribosomal protein S20 [Myxococcota bacterium]
MANSKSAEKRIRQNIKRRDRNRYWKATMRTSVKKVYKAVEKQEPTEQLQSVLKSAVKMIAHVSSKGVIHKKTASRKISRLTKFVNKQEQAA